MQKSVLVAEIDGNGEVEGIWLWAEGMRHARPLSESQEDQIEKLLERSEISGASAGAVLRWHDRRHHLH